mmetsp:Transcript_41567/g.109724  ORF Transcript_41567/g.109724 Transcript_41567/m.109724 type:complete len:204 (-) Transcript_41567:86-697(-)
MRVLHRELLERQRELPDLGVVRTSVLLQRQLILLLLPGGDRPLLELLLVPVHLQLELIELLVPSHELVGEAVDLVLLVFAQLQEADDLGVDAAELPGRKGLEVHLGVGLVPLRVDELLRVHQLLLHVDKVVGHDLDTATLRGDRLLDVIELDLLSLDLRVELLVRLGSVGRKVMPIHLHLHGLRHCSAGLSAPNAARRGGSRR